MEKSYAQVLERIIKYRLGLNMTQQKASEIVGLTQSHYSKLELGHKVISYSALDRLNKSNWDIDYIITGKECSKTKLDELFLKCPDEKKSDLLQLLVWITNQGAYNDAKTALTDYGRKIEFLRLRTTDDRAREHVWYGIRMASNMTQSEISDVLKINTRKYRGLERDELKPDAEMLTNLYERLGFYPSVVMDNRWSDLREINDIWQSFNPGLKNELYQFLLKGYDLMIK